MATTPTTLATIILVVRRRSNMENNQFVTDAELTTEINNSLSHLDAILVSKFSDYKLKNSILSAASATGYITLPSDFLKLRGVDVQVNANDADGYLEMKEFSFQHRIRKPYLLASAPAGYSPGSVSYRLQDQVIAIEPISLATQWNYRVWYTPDYVPLVNTTDTLQSYMDSQAWYEYAVEDCCAKIAAKQDLDPSTFAMRKNELAELITKLAAPGRSSGEPVAVVDSRGHFGGSPYGFDW